MNIEEIRAKLDNGQATIGSWLQLPSPDVAELMAAAGYDWIAGYFQGNKLRGGLPICAFTGSQQGLYQDGSRSRGARSYFSDD